MNLSRILKGTHRRGMGDTRPVATGAMTPNFVAPQEICSKRIIKAYIFHP